LDNFNFKASLMMFIAAAICWAFNMKESYLNYGFALMAIYILQVAIQKIKDKKDKEKPLNII